MSCYKSYTADVWSSETQNHPNSESFWTQDNKASSRTDTQVKKKMMIPWMTIEMRDTLEKMDKCSLWDYLAHWET